MIFRRWVQIRRRTDDTPWAFFWKWTFKMAAGDMRRNMLWCIFHELFHVFTLKLVNILFNTRQRTDITFQTPTFKVTWKQWLSTYRWNFCFKHCVFDTNSLQFNYNLIITINDGVLLTKPRKLVRVIPRSSVSNGYFYRNLSPKLGFLSARINRS